jgi:hypothetical protein
MIEFLQQRAGAMQPQTGARQSVPFGQTRVYAAASSRNFPLFNQPSQSSSRSLQAPVPSRLSFTVLPSQNTLLQGAHKQVHSCQQRIGAMQPPPITTQATHFNPPGIDTSTSFYSSSSYNQPPYSIQPYHQAPMPAFQNVAALPATTPAQSALHPVLSYEPHIEYEVGVPLSPFTSQDS